MSAKGLSGVVQDHDGGVSSGLPSRFAGVVACQRCYLPVAGVSDRGSGKEVLERISKVCFFILIARRFS